MKTIRLMTLLVVVLFTTMAFAQTKETQISAANSTKLLSDNEEISKAKAEIAELLKNEVTISIRGYEVKDQRAFGDWITPENILVLEDRIVFSFKENNTIFYFSDLIDCKIYLLSYGKKKGGTKSWKYYHLSSERKWQ